ESQPVRGGEGTTARVPRRWARVSDRLGRVCRDHLGELRERVLDLLSGFRGGEQIRSSMSLRGATNVGLRYVHFVLQVGLVGEELDRDIPGDLHDGGDPFA